TGELRQVTAVGGDYAWNVPVSANSPSGAPPATCCSLPEAGGTSPAGPAPDSKILCRVMLWSTPQGFVRAAMANNATTTRIEDGAEVSFTIDGKYKMTGIINAQNQVERVRTWISQSVVGDMLVETQYSGYKDFGGIQFPSHVLQKQDRFPSLDLTVASVIANPVFDVTVPDNVRNAPRPPVTVNAQEVADGVFWLTG